MSSAVSRATSSALAVRAAALAAAICLLAAGAHLFGQEAPEGERPAAGVRAAALRVAIETIAVDRRGTWSVGRDEADLFPGSSGSLSKSATLFGREDGSAREMVQLSARIVPARRADGSCDLRIDLEARTVAAGAGGAAPRPASRVDRRTAEFTVRPDEERLVEAYDSPVTRGRLALKVRCAAAPPAVEASPRFVDFVLSISRAEGKRELRPLKSDALRAAVGREASNLFSFNVPLEPRKGGGKRYRKEEVEVTLTPVLISVGLLQVEMRVRGELATVSATEATIPHLIDRAETLVVGPGEPHSQEIDVAASGSHEGWSRVRYRLEVVSRF